MQVWFQWACRHFGLQNANASDWNLNGKQLCELSHAEFVRRVAFDPGDLFWTHLELLRKCKIVGKSWEETSVIELAGKYRARTRNAYYIYTATSFISCLQFFTLPS